MRDFLETVTIAEPDESSISNPVQDNDVISVDENMEEIQELEDMGTLARNLIGRIQRLRAQIHPNYNAALATLTPTTVPDNRDERSTHGTENTSGHPMVEEMD